MTKFDGIRMADLLEVQDPDKDGGVTLVFSDMPLELRKWTVDDSQGIKTTVSLLGSRFAVSLDSSLFNYQVPEPVNTTE